MAELSPSGTNAPVAGTGPHRARRYVADDHAIPEDATTVSAIMEWVGDDRARAQVALDAENERDTPRVTLVEQAETLLTDPEPDPEPVILDSSDEEDAEPSTED